MVVDEFDVVSVIVFPAEAEPPLTIDANAELPSTISLQRFQSIAGRRAQIGQCGRSMELLHPCKRLRGETG
jgi:hypothetical protein